LWQGLDKAWWLWCSLCLHVHSSFLAIAWSCAILCEHFRWSIRKGITRTMKMKLQGWQTGNFPEAMSVMSHGDICRYVPDLQS
jgi:hypothetical protein